MYHRSTVLLDLFFWNNHLLDLLAVWILGCSDLLCNTQAYVYLFTVLDVDMYRYSSSQAVLQLTGNSWDKQLTDAKAGRSRYQQRHGEHELQRSSIIGVHGVAPHSCCCCCCFRPAAGAAADPSLDSNRRGLTRRWRS